MHTRTTRPVTLNQDIRHRYGLAFDTDQTDIYHGVRPGYQTEIVDFLTDKAGGLAVDLGAGTGKFSATLVNSGWKVVAVDPSANMLAVLADHYPETTTVVSKVETLDTAAWSHRADLVVAAQAWHWIDTRQGTHKVTELLSADGVFGVVHHQIDTSIPWVLRLCKIMHSGDVHAIEHPPTVGSALSPPVGQWWRWKQELAVDQVHQLMMTRAYYLRTTDKQRQRMHDNLQWYLLEHLGYAQSSTIQIPYVTAAWRMQRAS